MTSSVSVAAAPVDKRFIGHPLGLMFLVLGEAFERFAFYGTNAILSLYLTKQLLLPGHAEHVVGVGVLKALAAHGQSAASVVATATAVVGLYTMFCYITPLVGGWVADQWAGRSRTIAIGAILMVAGYAMMAFEQSFVLAILMILVGVGCFKGNIAAQIGDLYAPDDLRRSSGFQIFTLSIQCGAILAPIVCGGLAAAYGWKYGFFAAGASMALGLAILTLGRPWLPAARASGTKAAKPPPLTRRDWITIAILIGMVPALSLSAVGNMQIFNTYLIWGDQHYNLVVGGKAMPASWLVSLDAIVSAGCLIAVLAFWRLWARFWREPGDLAKMIIGCLISATAPLLLAAASVQEAATGQKIGLMWGVAFHVVNDIGFVNIYGVGMALFTRVAPKSLTAMMIAVYYFYLSFGGALAGYLGGLLEPLGSVKFWLLHAGLCAAGAVMLLAFGLVFGGLLKPEAEPEAAAEPAMA